MIKILNLAKYFYHSVKKISFDFYKYITFVNKKGFTRRKYHFYIIFSEIIDNKIVWSKTDWANIFEPLFQEILNISPDFKNTGVRVLAYKRENEQSEYFTDVKFGRLKWDNKSHEKWTVDNNTNFNFANFESWTPIWTICEKNDAAPDIYVSVSNEHSTNKNISCQFDVFTVIAIAEDLNSNCRDLIIELSKQLNSKRTVCNIRLWSEGKKDKSKNWEFINWIQDTDSYGIYKNYESNNLHETDFQDIEFEPYWETIYKK
jgi:hypothetical protein